MFDDILKQLTLIILVVVYLKTSSNAQTDTTLHNVLQSEIKELKREIKDYKNRFDQLEKSIDDITNEDMAIYCILFMILYDSTTPSSPALRRSSNPETVSPTANLANPRLK